MKLRIIITHSYTPMCSGVDFTKSLDGTCSENPMDYMEDLKGETVKEEKGVTK